MSFEFPIVRAEVNIACCLNIMTVYRVTLLQFLIIKRIFYQIIIIIVTHIFFSKSLRNQPLFRKNEKNFSQCTYPEDNDSCKSSMKRRESYERDDWRMKEDTEMISIQFRNL